MATLDELFQQIRAEFDALVAEARAVFEDEKVTWREVLGLVPEAFRRIVAIVEVVQAAGEQKRELAIYCVDQFYLQVIAPLDLPGPDWLLDPAVGRLVHELAGVAIDWLVKVFNRDGWPVIGEMGPFVRG
jgi:hypothetical protein